MKKVIILLLLLPVFGIGQTYFGSVGVPTDNGTSAASPVSFANPPIASMVTGDLVIVYAYCRNAAATISINNAGGQTWTTETARQSATSTLTGQVFWCRYNGTWSAAPSFTFSSTTNTNAVMHVFRPTSGTNQWAKETSFPGGGLSHNSLEDFIANATIAQVGGSSATANTCVGLAIWSTDDDNSWGTLSGTGWTQVTSPASQFRNTSGSDVSSAYAYKISTAQASPSLTQTANGNDPGVQGMFFFYEFTANTRNANSDFFKVFNKR